MTNAQLQTDNCPLCHGKAYTFFQDTRQHFFKCPSCYGIFLDKNLRLTYEEELARYETHNNDIADEKYQQFVSPITSAVLRDFTVAHRGLDFGAGTGPVISKILEDNDFQIVQYDPFFHKNEDLLKSSYDYIVCCEVIEHFFDPQKEFSLLKKLVKPNGKLYCMTLLFDDGIDFQNWFYKNDPTHVFLYHKKTIRRIQEIFQFSNVYIENRLITFSN